MQKQRLRPCLVHHFKYMFSVFKQYYTYFYTFFHPYVFPKKTENCCLNIRTKWALSQLEEGDPRPRGTVHLSSTSYVLQN